MEELMGREFSRKPLPKEMREKLSTNTRNTHSTYFLAKVKRLISSLNQMGTTDQQ